MQDSDFFFFKTNDQVRFTLPCIYWPTLGLPVGKRKTWQLPWQVPSHGSLHFRLVPMLSAGEVERVECLDFNKNGNESCVCYKHGRAPGLLASLSGGRLTPWGQAKPGLVKENGRETWGPFMAVLWLAWVWERLSSSPLEPHPSRPRKSPQTQLQDKGFSMNHLPFSRPGPAHPGHPSLLFVLLCSVVISCVIS